MTLTLISINDHPTTSARIAFARARRDMLVALGQWVSEDPDPQEVMEETDATMQAIVDCLPSVVP